MLRKNYYFIGLTGHLAFYIMLMTSAHAYEFPPYEGLSLKIEGQVAESYSNNVNYSSDESDTVEDWITQLSLGMGLKYEGERRLLEVMGSINRQIRTDTGDLENSSERGIINFRNEFSKYDLITFNNTFIHTEVPGTIDEGLDAAQCEKLEDLFGREQVRRTFPECDRFEEEFGRFTGKFDSYSNTANVDYSRNFSERFRTGLGYTYRRNWSDAEGTNDSDQNTFRARADYQYSAATLYFMRYSYSNSSYESGTDVDIQRVSAGIRRYITKRFYIEGSGGVDFTSSENNSENNGRIEAAIAGELDPKTTVRAAYMKEDEFASSTEDVFRNWRVSGSISRAFMEDLNLVLSGFHGEGEFVSIDVTDTLFGGSVNLDYLFWQDKHGKRVSGRLGYTYSDLKSTDESRDYSRSGVNLGLTAGF